MIYKKCIMTINKNNATLDEDIYLFRLDKNIELHFSIVNNRYKFDKSDLNNIIAQTNAAYFQIRLYRSDEIKYTFAIQPTQDGVAVLTITDDLINDPIELGEYDFQISLLDADKTSMISMPIVKQQLHVCEPLVDNQAIMGRAVLGLSSLASGEIKNAFDSEGNYIREIHNDGDILSAQLVNKFEEALDTNTKAIKSQNTNLTIQNSISIGRIGNVGAGSSAAGMNVEASGMAAHAEGYGTTATGMSSHAEGGSTKSTGRGSHAEGVGAIASGNGSHAEGSNTIASSESQHVQGKYNIEDKAKKYAHIVGNGEYDNRSNAHTLDWQGNAWYAGEVQGTNLPYVISSKVLVTVPASDITLQKAININNVSINKDRRYYIEFLGSKKLCSVMMNKEISNSIVCSIDGYVIQVFNEATDLTIFITNTNTDDTPISTDLVIYEEEVKYLDSKYLETDLVAQNSISMGRTGDIGMASVAIGVGVEASGNGSFAEGGGTKASNDSSHAEGTNTTASGSSSHAEGSGTTASGDGSHAEGSTTTASGVNSHAEGDYTTASGASSHAEGYGSKASSQFQHVQGKYNIEDTNRKYAHIVGNGAGDAKRSNAHTLDWKGNAWFAGEVQGTNLPYTVSSKVLTTIPASDIKINDEITVNNISVNKNRKYYIEFLGSKKLCNVTISEDSATEISCTIGNYEILGIIFSSNLMLGVHTIKPDITTTDTFTDLIIYEEEIKCLDNKYLENDLVIQNSISLGRRGDIGVVSSAIGMDVEATGMASHAEGYGTIASGNFSHAEGSFTQARAEDSHAEGSNTIASFMYQHVQGKYNIEDTNNKYAHIVGNGKDENTRSNAHTLDWEGNAWYSGKLSQEGTPTEDKDLATKKYVDDKVASLPQLSFNEAGELVVTINGVSKTFVPKS